MDSIIRYAAGKLCEFLIPVKHSYYEGKGTKAAICTLGSLDLLESISYSQDLMANISIVGRLLSENNGIDAMIRYVIGHPLLNWIILCGNDTKGHNAGQTLLSLFNYGTNSGGRICHSTAPYPFLKSSEADIEIFRKQIKVVDLIGNKNVKEIRSVLKVCLG